MKSCLLQKSNPGSSGTPHVTASINGTAKTFNITPIASRTTFIDVTSVSITGIASTTTMESFSITLTNAP